MTQSDDGANDASEDLGITDEDRELITAFLETPRYGRSVDDLHGSSEE